MRHTFEAKTLSETWKLLKVNFIVYIYLDRKRFDVFVGRLWRIGKFFRNSTK